MLCVNKFYPPTGQKDAFTRAALASIPSHEGWACQIARTSRRQHQHRAQGVAGMRTHYARMLDACSPAAAGRPSLLWNCLCCCLDIIRLLEFAKKTCNGHCYAKCSNGQLGVIWVLVHVCCCASLRSVQLWSERACNPIPVCMFALMLRTRRQSSLASVSFRGRLARRKTEAAVQCAPSGWENLVPWINTLYNI